MAKPNQSEFSELDSPASVGSRYAGHSAEATGTTKIAVEEIVSPFGVGPTRDSVPQYSC